ncbi:hypothetical protein HOLleu_39195 [Holothuria leucospilota]|uniref:Uncharacterized protein n=1 Tax=Holothuria leucospilota TaxID=206669 RepID=A0A9Q1BDY7_HOLLE|nr:hypothetical protein HOLleu_39195 [Holothuria leucospilota]
MPSTGGRSVLKIHYQYQESIWVVGDEYGDGRQNYGLPWTGDLTVDLLSFSSLYQIWGRKVVRPQPKYWGPCSPIPRDRRPYGSTARVLLPTCNMFPLVMESFALLGAQATKGVASLDVKCAVSLSPTKPLNCDTPNVVHLLCCNVCEKGNYVEHRYWIFKVKRLVEVSQMNGGKMILFDYSKELTGRARVKGPCPWLFKSNNAFSLCKTLH